MSNSHSKVMIVTGGGGTIGRAICTAAASAGFRVVVNDIGATLEGGGFDPSAAQSVADAVIASGGEAITNFDSISRFEGASCLVEATLAAFGRVDAVINNAGNVRNDIFHKLDPSDWDAVLNVHLHGSFYVSRAVAPHYRKQRSGTFVHMTSAAGLLGNVGQANYMAAKLGVTALSKAIAIDMARFGVRSNCIAPFAASRMTELVAAGGEEQQQRLEQLRRFDVNKGALVPLACYLSSDQSQGVTGQIFVARGNEIHLMSQPRPIASVQRANGWSMDDIGSVAMTELGSKLVPLDLSADIFSADAV